MSTTINTDAEAMVSSLTTVQAAVAGFSKISAGIAALKAEHPLDVVADASTKEGMATLTAGYKAWRTPRLELERTRKEAKAPVTALGKNIDAFAGQIEKDLRAGEDHYGEQIEAYKAEQARLAAEAKKKDDERKEKHQKAIAVIRSYTAMATGLPSTRIAAGIAKLEAMRFGAEWEEFASAAVIAQTETLEGLRTMLAQAKQAEAEAEALRIKNEAEAAAREQQRLENERVAAALKAQQDALDAKAAELKRQEDEFNALREAMAPVAAPEPAQQATAMPPAAAADAAPVEAAPVLNVLEPASVTAARNVLVMRLNPATAPAPAPAPAATEEPTLKLGDVNALIGAGFSMTEAFVCGTLRIVKPTPPAGSRGCLFYPSQLPLILEALAEHALSLRRG